MKKIISIIISMLLLFSFVGCSNSSNSDSGSKKTNEKQKEFLKSF